MDLSVLNTYAEFAEFVQQIAVITATSHVRGSVGHSPVQFKEVLVHNAPAKPKLPLAMPSRAS